MEANQVDQLLMIYGNKLPAPSLPVVRERLLNMDYNVANMAFGQMKDPTISLILSILVGGYGVDRIYIGDVGLGVLKLLTCGGCSIWWLIDIFLIMDRTREKNLEELVGNVVF